MNNPAREKYRGLGRRGPGLLRRSGAAFLALSLLLPVPGAWAAEFEISADSFTVVNQVNISSATYFQTRATVPPDPALATQLLTPGGLYFDATYYNVWDRNALAWVKLATGTVEAGRVAKAGDFMSGQLTTASTITVQGDAFSVGASTLVVIGGSVGIGTPSPGARLTIGADLNGAAMSPTLRVNAGALGATAGDEIAAGSIGFTGANKIALGIRGYRASAGSDWRTTAIGLGMDVDNTIRAGGGGLFLQAGGSVGIGGIGVAGASNGTLVVQSTSVTAGNPVLSVRSIAGAELLRVQQDGSVGIGTASPGGALEVNGTIALSGASPTYRVANVASPIAASDVATKAYVDAAARGVQYMGVTPASYTGNLGRIPGANAKCDSAYAGSHFCHLDEVFSTSTSTFALGWVRSNAVPRYTTTPSTVYDCSGGGAYRQVGYSGSNDCYCADWLGATNGNSGSVLSGNFFTANTCDKVNPLHCCK